MPHPVPDPTELLVAVGRDRDRDAFATLFREIAPKLRRYLLGGGLDGGRADEIVQEVMLTVWRRADTFDPTRASASTWIFTIARNRRIDALRHERRPEIDPRDPALVSPPERSPDAHIDAARDQAAVVAALSSLPAEQVRVIEAAYFQDRTLSAIAAGEELPLGTVKSRMRLALQRLRLALGPA